MLAVVLSLFAQAALPGTPQGAVYWTRPCVVQKPDDDSRVERMGRELTRSVGMEFGAIIRCVQPEHHPQAIFLAKMIEGNRLLFVYNREMDTQISDQAMRGLIAHEVSHFLVDCRIPFYRDETEAEYNACEASVDQKAVTLVGNAAVRLALTEFQKLHSTLAQDYIMRLSVIINDRRAKLVQ